MKQFFQEDNGRYSMKRLCGLLCTIALCATMYHNQFSGHVAYTIVGSNFFINLNS